MSVKQKSKKNVAKYDHLRTPTFVLNYIRDAFGELNDMCPATVLTDSLEIAWPRNVYMFAPASKVNEFFEKLLHELYIGNVHKCVAFVPYAALANSVGDKYIYGHARDIYVITHPIQFDDKHASPMCFVVYDRHYPINYSRATVHLLQVPDWTLHVTAALSEKRARRCDHAEIVWQPTIK